MLTPDQITALRDMSGQIVDPIVEFLIEDIARRVSEAGQLTGTAAYQVWQAQKLGLSQRQLKKELRKRLKVSHRQLRQLLTQAAETGYDFDIRRFPQVQSVPFAENTTLQQRNLERSIRKTKRKILIDESTGDAEKLQWDQIRLVRTREEYHRFSKAAGLPEQGFTWKHGKAAEKAAKPIIKFDAEHLVKEESELLPKYKLAAIPDEKLTGYALNMDHPVGRNKAIVFQKVLGYNVDNRDILLRQVRSGLAKYRATEKQSTQYGRPFEVTMMICGANGRYAPVKTAWQIDNGSETPRLVSIYVDE